MCPFDWMILAHLIGDYLIQTEYEAMNKATGHWFNRALIAHCLKYTATFGIVFYIFSINQWWLILIFLSHMVFDRRFLIILWRKYVNRNTDASIKNTFWLTIVIDQIFHLIIIVLVSAFERHGG